MDLITILLFAVGAAEIVLGVYIGIQKPMTPIRKAYTWVIFMVAGWVITNAFFRFFPASGNALAAELTDRMTYFFGAGITASFFYFSLLFPYARRPITQELFSYILLSGATVAFLSLFTRFIIEHDEITAEHGVVETFGSLYLAYVLWFLVMWVWSITNLVQKYREGDTFFRWQIRMLLIGVSIPLVISIVFDLVIPYYAIASLGWIASVSSVIWLGFTTYIVVKR